MWNSVRLALVICVVLSFGGAWLPRLAFGAEGTQQDSEAAAELEKKGAILYRDDDSGQIVGLSMAEADDPSVERIRSIETLEYLVSRRSLVFG